MRHFIVGLFLPVTVFASNAAQSLKDGDIVFHTSRSSQSLAVQRATGSKYSHMGMVIFRAGKPYVLEAVETARYTPLDRWVGRGEKGHFVAKRLRNADTVLTPDALRRLRVEAERFVGRPYDLYFGWSDDRIYCSELVWKAYDRSLGIQIGPLQKVRDFNLSDPAVKVKMRERYGDHVPLEAPVISPVAMFESKLLITVVEK